jgi:hypothetical protein
MLQCDPSTRLRFSANQSASFSAGDSAMAKKRHQYVNSQPASKSLSANVRAGPSSSSATNLAGGGGGAEIQRSIDDCQRKRESAVGGTAFSHERSQSMQLLSPFDEKEEWNKISEIIASISSGLLDKEDALIPPFVDKEICGRQGWLPELNAFEMKR